MKVSLDNPIDSLAFGVKGSKLENILFASSNDGNLFAIDLNTLTSTTIASGGSHGENIKTTADGRIYLSQGSHIDVIKPLLPPQILSKSCRVGRCPRITLYEAITSD